MIYFSAQFIFRDELRPEIIEGDARNLQDYMGKIGLMNNSIQLVLMHPPYFTSLKYTAFAEGDLSHISDANVFCDQLQLIVKQSFDLLKEKGFCAVLIGDDRRNKKIIPLVFWYLKDS